MSYQNFTNLLNLHDVSCYKVSKATGISAATFSDWKYGRSVPKADKMKKLADFFGVSVDFIIGSETGLQNERAGYESVRARKLVPIVEEIRAGTPIITEDSHIGNEFADVENAEEYFFLKIHDKSMKNAGIIEDALVLFKKQQYAENGNIVVCLIGEGCATVKRYLKNKKNIYLIPENETCHTLKLSTDDFESGMARILGIAKEVKIKL